MRNHHDPIYPTYRAVSDISELLIRTCSDGLHEVRMGGDGDYKLHVVDADCAIPEHYRLVLTAHKWAWVYDDLRKVVEVRGENIEFYRGGGYSMIIRPTR